MSTILQINQVLIFAWDIS